MTQLSGFDRAVFKSMDTQDPLEPIDSIPELLLKHHQIKVSGAMVRRVIDAMIHLNEIDDEAVEVMVADAHRMTVGFFQLLQKAEAGDDAPNPHLARQFRNTYEGGAAFLGDSKIRPLLEKSEPDFYNGLEL